MMSVFVVIQINIHLDFILMLLYYMLITACFWDYVIYMFSNSIENRFLKEKETVVINCKNLLTILKIFKLKN